MIPKPAQKEVLIVGMSRSGTTVIADVLGAADGVHVEMEPHLIWKAGDFDQLDDEDHPRDEKSYTWIRARLTQESAGRLLIEKSPPNCLRPRTVHRVFPHARIVYVLREPVACLYSNYSKSTSQHALSPRIAVQKYLMPGAAKGQAASFDSDRKALGGRALWDQLRMTDVPRFLNYSRQLWHLRQRTGLLPFGPKLSGFPDIVRDVGLLGYHARCMAVAAEKALIFRELYGNAMQVVTLEDLVADTNAVVRQILDFVGSDVPAHILEPVIGGIEERQGDGSVPSEFAEQLALAISPQWSTQIAEHTAALHS